MVTFDRISEAHPAAISGALASHPLPHHDERVCHVVEQRAKRVTSAARNRRRR